ncbi:mechanosensitive ion channel family protein [Scytonema hofmannii FACHB-248]|uniref:Mechanosensitive ion channel family protein n=2 Tax=Nostocales TaxID=1161 RepID=A0ABR8GUT3_9CYAN|nr:mechanosensitive ion channel family protein [Scytonema hofmannii]MBD2606927.1 mechanosensitive ion channel family protein [Scytonema hofmannii FACHB-248]
MSNLSFSRDWHIWALIVGLGFPLVVVLLGEVIYHLQRRGRPMAATLQVVKNLVLPVLILMLLIRNVWKLDVHGNFAKVVETLFWISVIYASFSLFNVILFEKAEANTWRARMPKLLIDLARLFLVLVGSAIVLAAVWGADLAGLATGLGVSSIVIGLALQDTLGSIMSGIALLLERPFSVGDWLRVGNSEGEDKAIEGQVIDINWRSVRLLNLQRQVIIVPHQFIGKGIIHNYSQPERIYNQRINIGFSYDSPPNLVKQVLTSTALATQGILAKPEPESKTTSYDETAIIYEVEFFIENFEDVEQILDRFMTRIWYAAQRNNLTLYRYRYEYAVETADKTDSASSKLAQSLHSIPGFMPLAREHKNLDDLAKGTILQQFGAGEKVIRQGEPGNALYIIIAGQVLVTVTNEFGTELEVMTILRGEFFGEMALFTGEPSPVSIAAVEDLQVLVIYSDAVNTMIERQPSLGREIGQIIEARSKAVSMAQQADVSSNPEVELPIRNWK